MTKAQETAVAKIKSMAENMHGHCSDKYEIKEWEIVEYESFVSLYFSVGLKDDEGTMAAILGRESFHLFIGKRGGITYPTYKSYKGRSAAKRFNGNLMAVHCEQNH